MSFACTFVPGSARASTVPGGPARRVSGAGVEPRSVPLGEPVPIRIGSLCTCAWSSGALVRSRTPGMIRAFGTRLAVAATVRIGRRRNSATSATITGAAAAPISVPGPQTRATVNDAAADATLAMIRVCGEMPLSRRCSLAPVWGSEDSIISTYPAAPPLADAG